MATRLMLDTNVVLDLILAREPFLDDALAIFAMGEAGDFKLHLSTDAISTVFYVVERNRDAATARAAIERLLGRVRLAPLDEEAVRRGMRYEFVDIEDALVASVACAAGTDVIVTRNARDFAHSPVPVMTPAELLAFWNASRTG